MTRPNHLNLPSLVLRCKIINSILLVSSQVFGRLITEEALDRVSNDGKKEGVEEGDDVDLREHMVGILFSRSKLTHLQKQVRKGLCIVRFSCYLLPAGFARVPLCAISTPYALTP